MPHRIALVANTYWGVLGRPQGSPLREHPTNIIVRRRKSVNNIICIAGPTASGKTALAVELAKE